MASTAEIVLQIQGKNQASKVIKDVEKDVGGLGKAFQDIGKIASGFLAANVIQSGVGALTKGIGDAIGAARESLQVDAQLTAVLKSTGGAAGLTAKEIQDMASSLEKASLFEDEAILGGQNLLLTFTNIGKNVFPQATQTIVDMSQALGQDMKSSAIQLGKALNDPITGITALRRVGVSFNETQEETIKKLVESGRLEQAQKLILAELSKEFGGSALAASDAAGAQERMKDRMNELNEEIGARLIPIQEKLTEVKLKFVDLVVSKAIPALERLREWLGPKIQEALAIAIPFLQQLGIVVQEQFAKFQQYYESDLRPAIENVKTAVREVVSFIREHWGQIEPIVRPIFEQVKLIIETNVKVIMGILGILIDLIGGDFSGAWERMKKLVDDVWEGLIGTVRNALDLLKGLADVALAAGQAIADASMKELKKLPDLMLQVGKDAIAGLIRGLESQLSAVTSSAGRIVDAIPNAAKKLLGISSPSRVMHEVGVQAAQGLIKGLDSKLPELVGKAKKMGNIISSFSNPRSHGSLGSIPAGTYQAYGPGSAVWAANWNSGKRKGVVDPSRGSFMEALRTGRVRPEWVWPSYAVGTPWVPSDGLAYLHRGEAVIPASQNQSMDVHLYLDMKEYIVRVVRDQSLRGGFRGVLATV